jgi:hypothetical protein
MDLTNKTPEFYGKAELCYKWSNTLLSSAALRRYKKLILNKEGDDLEWAKNEWEILNDLAYAELMIACQDDMSYGIIDGSRSKIFPDGDAALAWKRLNEKFEPRNSRNLMSQ